MARVPREINGGQIAAMAYARSEQYSPLREAMARDAKAPPPQDTDQLEPIIDVISEAADG
jgi:hypothetical protein